MNTSLTILVLAAFASMAAADAGKCQSTLQMKEVAGMMGPDVRIEPVFSDGKLKAWRIYGTGTSKSLSDRAIESGAFMTHVCGMSASEILARDGEVCSSGDASKQFEVTFGVVGPPTKVLIRREP